VDRGAVEDDVFDGAGEGFPVDGETPSPPSRSHLRSSGRASLSEKASLLRVKAVSSAVPVSRVSVAQAVRRRSMGPRGGGLIVSYEKGGLRVPLGGRISA
jgi:hypothetical protein